MMTIKEREKIVKALECHASGKIENCDHCPYENIALKDDETCANQMLKDAISIIKELTEEIKDLEEEYDRVYEQAEADIHGNMADGGTSCHWCMDKTKADTVRGFVGYLKKQSFCCDPGNWISFDAIDADELDNYAKEFLEGNK